MSPYSLGYQTQYIGNVGSALNYDSLLASYNQVTLAPHLQLQQENANLKKPLKDKEDKKKSDLQNLIAYYYKMTR